MLILFKSVMPQREKYSHESLVSDLLGISYSAHDSLEDVRALQQLLSCKEVNEKAIIKPGSLFFVMPSTVQSTV